MGIIVPSNSLYWNMTIITTVDGQPKSFTTAIGILDAALPARDGPEIVDTFKATCIGSDAPWYENNYNTSWNFVGVDAMQVVDEEPVIFQNREGFNGTSSEDIAPPNCSLLVKKLTASGGRHHRGRMYLGPGLLQNDSLSDAGFLTTPFVTAYQAFFDSWYSDLIDADMVPTLFHSDITSPTAITSLSVESQIATQRRRLR